MCNIIQNGKGYLEHIALRDYLRSNEGARDEYGELKYKLAEKYRNDIDNYIDGKTDFVRKILDKTIYNI